MKDGIIILFLCGLLPLFFYKLGQSSLGSWDEGIYATIAQNMVGNGKIFDLQFNGVAFSDHPPGGIWLIALAYKLGGINEFTTRLGSALAGFGTVIVTYLLGKQLFSRWVGVSAAIALTSAYWFLYRSRLGDLDSLLTCFYGLTIFLAIKAVENKKYFWWLGVSLGYLLLIKAALPFAVVPTLLVIFWNNKKYSMREMIWLVGAAISVLGVWLVGLGWKDPQLVIWHFVHSGRGATVDNNVLASLNQLKGYLHNGIGKWFWPGIAGILIGLFTGQKKYLILAVFLVSYSLPMLWSKDIQIWHLIPLYPVMILAFFGLAYSVAGVFGRPGKAVIMAAGLYITAIQLNAAWYQFIDIPAFVSDEAILSREAGKYGQRLYIDGDFDPTAAFYSQKTVTKISDSELGDLFATQTDFLVITNDWRLKQTQIKPITYRILKKDRDKVLVIAN